MKRILTTVIVLVYLAVSSGFAVSMHFCMDRFASAQLGDSSDEACGKCGMEKGENRCCRDQVEIVKLETSHLPSQVVNFDFSLPEAKMITTAFLLSPLLNNTGEQRPIAHGPPLPPDDVYLRNCVFRI
jgi:hypothetical protein